METERRLYRADNLPHASLESCGAQQCVAPSALENREVTSAQGARSIVGALACDSAEIGSRSQLPHERRSALARGSVRSRYEDLTHRRIALDATDIIHAAVRTDERARVRWLTIEHRRGHLGVEHRAREGPERTVCVARRSLLVHRNERHEALRTHRSKQALRKLGARLRSRRILNAHAQERQSARLGDCFPELERSDERRRRRHLREEQQRECEHQRSP